MVHPVFRSSAEQASCDIGNLIPAQQSEHGASTLDRTGLVTVYHPETGPPPVTLTLADESDSPSLRQYAGTRACGPDNDFGRSGNQSDHIMQVLHEDDGKGSGTPWVLGGCHNPMAAM